MYKTSQFSGRRVFRGTYVLNRHGNGYTVVGNNNVLADSGYAASVNNYAGNGNDYATSGKIMLISIVILVVAILVVIFVHLYCRWRQIRHHNNERRRRQRRQLVFAAATSTTNTSIQSGLDPAVIKTLPVILFSSSDNKEKVVECAVCLSEFEEREKVRRLPACGHRFHIECIDMWFRSHSTCPLCRSTVEAVKQEPKTEEQSAIPGLVDGTAVSSTGDEEHRIGVQQERNAGGEELKSPTGRMAFVRRILSVDLRVYRTAIDLERGEEEEVSQRTTASMPPSPRPPESMPPSPGPPEREG